MRAFPVPQIADINPHVLNCFKCEPLDFIPAGMLHHPQRYTRWFELEFIFEGSGYILSEGRKYAARKGALFFRRPGMTVQGFPPYRFFHGEFDMVYDKTREPFYGNANYFVHTPHLSQFRNFIPLRDQFGLQIPFYMEVIRYSVFEELFLECYDEFNRKRRETPFILRALFMQIMREMWVEKEKLSQRVSSETKRNRTLRGLLAVKEKIDSNLKKQHSLAELAVVADLAPNYLCTCFRELTGENLFDYINKRKISIAKGLLLESHRSIKQIAFDLGFSSLPYFCRVFKKWEGLTPMGFRLLRNR